MNFSKQKYKAVVVDTWMAKVIYGMTLDELNKKIDATKSNHPNLKAEIYTRDDEAETPALAQWRLIETKGDEMTQKLTQEERHRRLVAKTREMRALRRTTSRRGTRNGSARASALRMKWTQSCGRRWRARNNDGRRNS